MLLVKKKKRWLQRGCMTKEGNEKSREQKFCSFEVFLFFQFFLPRKQKKLFPQQKKKEVNLPVILLLVRPIKIDKSISNDNKPKSLKFYLFLSK